MCICKITSNRIEDQKLEMQIYHYKNNLEWNFKLRGEGKINSLVYA